MARKMNQLEEFMNKYAKGVSKFRIEIDHDDVNYCFEDGCYYAYCTKLSFVRGGIKWSGDTLKIQFIGDEDNEMVKFTFEWVGYESPLGWFSKNINVTIPRIDIADFLNKEIFMEED